MGVQSVGVRKSSFIELDQFQFPLMFLLILAISKLTKFPRDFEEFDKSLSTSRHSIPLYGFDCLACGLYDALLPLPSVMATQFKY